MTLLYRDRKLIMATTDEHRHQAIRNAVLLRPEAVVDQTIALWEQLASELISIIGEHGFQSLYSRSVHMAAAASPWIMLCQSTQSTDPEFTGLRNCLEARDFTEVSEASVVLLNTFIDILILLIGEPLTSRILRSAWGDDVMDLAGKEVQE